MSISDDERAFVRFDPDGRFMWADQTGLIALNDDELDTAYERARPFILKQVYDLVIHHAWTENDSKDDNLLVWLFPPDGRMVPIWELIWSFKLPTTFSEFVNCDNPGTWGRIFEHIKAKQLNGNKEDSAICEPEPLVNILYALQCIAPGLLTVVGITAWNDDDEKECARGLPPTNWLLRHAKVLTEVLGEAYDRLLYASKDPKKPFKYATVSFKFDQFGKDTDGDTYDRNDWPFDSDYGGRMSDYGRRSDRSAEDFAACNDDCEWCGHCFY
ncbi:hypothetical protein BU17DRAFT_90976 [Hysterangium stoloniferum]|nr:hypothetical protein BU17DRAFT_90976 [Hysterangium stoloniferum]